MSKSKAVKLAVGMATIAFLSAAISPSSFANAPKTSKRASGGAQLPLSLIDYAITRSRSVGYLLLIGPGLLYSTYLLICRAGFAMVYKPVSLKRGKVLHDIVYRPESDDPKHRLDLFVPEGANWPLLIFVHGGRLSTGDKCLRVAGADIYANIGRFYASRGIGVAVINYRLQPKVTWREQVDDVACAAAWLYSHARNYGADPSRLFIAGHSAGAQLAARVALDSEALGVYGLSPAILKGMIAVSGVAFDLTDSKTYELGRNFHLYEAGFSCGDRTENWKREASPVTYATPGAPPFLILYAEREAEFLQRQSRLLHKALHQNGIPSKLLMVPAQIHRSIVLTLSRPDKTSAPAILGFMGCAAHKTPRTSRALKNFSLKDSVLAAQLHAQNSLMHATTL